MSKRTAVVLLMVLSLGGIVAGLAIGWVLFHNGKDISVKIDVTDETWLIATMLGGALLFVLIYLRAPQRFRELVTWLLVAYLVGGAIILGDLLISMWAPAQIPIVSGGTGDQAQAARTVHLLGTSEDVKLAATTLRLLLILTAGAAGGVVNALWVFAARTGNASFRERWAWWYVAGPIFGAASAFGLSLAFGGSLVEFDAPANADASDVGLLAFVAFIAGLFAKAVFERLSRLLPEPTRLDGPRITSTSPSVIRPDATASQTVEIQGTGFTDATSVYFEGTKLTPTRDGNELTVALDPTPAGTRPIALEVVTEERHADAVVIPRG